ncbi:MAG: TSUP family transporter [Gammaproteobacteria bacterium]|nr:TSUP family transporter [Gammaproteobacteria bacterium]
MPEPSIMLLLFLAGVLAGVSNAVAGGGTFFTFPVFLSAGIPPVVANASNAVAVWPGHALAAFGYRRELRDFSHTVKGSIAIAMLGGVTGALLLAYMGNRAFSMLIPFLILFATLLFVLGKGIN